MLFIIQCPRCEYGDSFTWAVEGYKNDFGDYICSKFPDGIPEYVIDATKDCPKFKVKR